MWDPVWEEVFRNQAWGKYPGEDLIRFVARNYYRAPDRSKVRILEVGCGPGANLWYLAREGFGFVGIDGSATAIRRAAERLDAECPGWREFGELRVGDIGKLPYETGAFDAVIDNEALYANPWEAACSIYLEMARVTKSGGKLYSRTFAAGSWGDGTGESCGRGAWFCSEGPLAEKGFSRFTALAEIPDLLQGYCVDSVERLGWTLNSRRDEVLEWIISAEKVS